MKKFHQLCKAKAFVCIGALFASFIAINPVYAQLLYNIKDLGTLGGNYSHGQGINALGQVTGYSLAADGREHAFVTNVTGNMIDLGVLSGVSSRGMGINDVGQVVGDVSSYDSSSFKYFTRPFVTTPPRQNSCRLKFLKKIKFEISDENLYKVFPRL
jgi:probable HAF family extracellular repeat protein